jgi:hypothetical protein
MYKILICVFIAIVLSNRAASAQTKLLDDFEALSGWELIVSDGVRGKIESAPGRSGQALVLDFEFHAGSGYAIAQKRLPLDLPENYKFTFYLRGETPANNFEFKLLDAQENVLDQAAQYRISRAWKKRTIKKRHHRICMGPAAAACRAK